MEGTQPLKFMGHTASFRTAFAPSGNSDLYWPDALSFCQGKTPEGELD